MKIKPVILCGGAGTRLWPKSHKNLAKQFIFTAEKLIPDDEKMRKLKQKITNISKIVTLENDIKSKIDSTYIKTNKIDFVESDITIKPIDYYYTNPIARSSKVMSECRKISKKFLFTGIEKAS